MTKKCIITTGVGANSKLWLSSDYYDTYTVSTLPCGVYDLFSIATDEAGNWVAVGRQFAASYGEVFYSHDDGLTWTLSDVNALIGDRDLMYVATDKSGNWVAVSTANAMVGYAVIIMSTDNGETWSIVHTCNEGGYLDAHGVAYGDGAWIANNTHRIYRSTDGSTWSVVYTNTDVTFQHVATDGDGIWCIAAEFGDYYDGVLEDYPGQIYRSSNNGANWSLTYQATSLYFFQCFGTDGNGNWCVGCNGYYDDGYILRSVNDGVDWSLVYTHPVENFIFNVATSEDGTWLASSSSDDDALILRSTDAGATWSVLSSGTSVNCTYGIAYGGATCPTGTILVGAGVTFF